MAIGKRQLVLAALVVALGAAVYLNWQFSGGDLLAANASPSSDKELGQAQLVNGSAMESSSDAVTTGVSAGEGSGSSASDPASSGSAVDTFAQARLDRQKARDEAVELLEKVLNDAETSESAKKDAVAQAALVAQNILKENNMESLIKAKGFADCVVFLQNEECSVVVKVEESVPENAVIIKDIVTGQSGIPGANIKIIESK